MVGAVFEILGPVQLRRSRAVQKSVVHVGAVFESAPFKIQRRNRAIVGIAGRVFGIEIRFAGLHRFRGGIQGFSQGFVVKFQQGVRLYLSLDSGFKLQGILLQDSNRLKHLGRDILLQSLALA